MDDHGKDKGDTPKTEKSKPDKTTPKQKTAPKQEKATPKQEKQDKASSKPDIKQINCNPPMPEQATGRTLPY